MIELITGLPGNCKTLFTIAELRDRAKKESRQVFYHGIPLSDQGKNELGWIELEDATKWMDCPPNSICVIDECQKIFRNRSLGQIPGKHVTDLETHRHLGIDLVFITQHPSLIDPAIRKLTGKHRHMVRVMGMERSTVHTWAAVRDNCDKPVGRKDSEKMVWKFDKSIYPLYKSAEVHTVKREIPMRLKLLLLVPLVLALAAWSVYKLTVGKKAETVKATPSLNQPGQPAALPTAIGAAPAKLDPLAEAKDYLWRQTPRIEGVQSTAPKYDSLTTPTAVPVAAMCVYMPAKKRCSCYSQQATPMDVKFNDCMQIAHNGQFQEFNPNGNDQKQRDAVTVLDNTDRMPISGASGKDSGPSQTYQASKDGYGVLGKVEGVRVPDLASAADASRRAEPEATAGATNPRPGGYYRQQNKL